MARYKGLSKELSDIAKYFIFLSNRDNRTMVNLKLQKLVYYAQAWNLVFNNKRLFKDPIEAWIHGPAVHSLWRKYKKFGFKKIDVNVPDNFNFPEKTKKALDDVWYVYGGFDAKFLERLTHYERPWQDARDGLNVNEFSKANLTAGSMKKFYKEKYKKILQESIKK